ncbi:AraC family transcriptional regulator [Cohnella sp. GCM10027633]|uniref:AraC family transcriptional regulator n=1 Tax=unclassified Cohnella TaxID=2636738 RepID=UPI003638D7AE
MEGQTVSVSLLYPIMKTMSLHGYEWRAFCEEAGIDPDIALDAEARMPSMTFERVVATAVRRTGDELFGLRQGNRVAMSDLGMLGYVMMHSGTLGGAMEATRRYNDIVCSGFRVVVETEGDDVIVAMSLDGSENPSRHCIEDMSASFYKTMRELSCRSVPIKSASFAHEPPSAEALGEYMEVFGVMPAFGAAANSLRFENGVLDYPVIGSDARLREVFGKLADDALAKLTGESALTNRLRAWIVSCMPSHYPTLAQAAQAMLMSARTLQDKLKAEDTSYNRLANEVRKELAIAYLARPEYAIGEIAYLLHFSEPSAFHSAFRRWTDAAPGEYRQRARSGA